MTDLLGVEVIAERLADEGVPLQAIARATRTPSGVLRGRLREACDAGRLIGLPQEDWPPGFPRDGRALQLSRLVGDDRTAVMLAVRRLFGMTPHELGLFLSLLQLPMVRSDRRERRDFGAIEVHVYHMRKRLAPYAIGIKSLWGFGYQLAAEDRRRAMDLILAEVGAATGAAL